MVLPLTLSAHLFSARLLLAKVIGALVHFHLTVHFGFKYMRVFRGAGLCQLSVKFRPICPVSKLIGLVSKIAVKLGKLAKREFGTFYPAG